MRTQWPCSRAFDAPAATSAHQRRSPPNATRSIYDRCSAMVESSAQPSLIRPRRVGHKGAAHLAPGNTLASFDAALAHGVDMIELDVLSEHYDGSGELLVAHDYQDMRARPRVVLRDALEHLAGERFAALEFDIDVKLPGYELRVLDALRELRLIERTLLSGMFPDSLALVRAAEPSL